MTQLLCYTKKIEKYSIETLGCMGTWKMAKKRANKRIWRLILFVRSQNRVCNGRNLKTLYSNNLCHNRGHDFTIRNEIHRFSTPSSTVMCLVYVKICNLGGSWKNECRSTNIIWRCNNISSGMCMYASICVPWNSHLFPPTYAIRVRVKVKPANAS